MIILALFFITSVSSCSPKNDKAQTQEQEPLQDSVQTSQSVQVQEQESPSVVQDNTSNVSQEPTEAMGEKEAESENALNILDITTLDLNALRLKPSCYISEEKGLNSSIIYDHSDIYFLGFSSDGKLAYIYEQFLEGKGCTDVYVFIQDLVTDKILWQLDNLDNEGFDDLESTTVSFIKKNAKTINEAFVKYNIQQSDCSYKMLPYTNNGESINIEVQITDTGKLFHEYLKIIDYSCIAVNNKKQKKTLSSKKDEVIEDVFVCGYVKNPYEDRLAIVIAEQRYGFEGCDIHYHVLGCAINSGF